MKTAFSHHQRFVFFCACFTVLMFSALASWSIGIGTVYADFSEYFEVETPPVLPAYSMMSRSNDDKVLSLSKSSLWGFQDGMQQDFDVNGILRDYDPMVNTMTIIHNGTSYDVSVYDYGKFSQKITLQLGYNVIGLLYNGSSYTFMRTCQASIGGTLTGKVDQATLTAEPNAIVDLDTYAENFLKGATRVILKQCTIDYSNYSFTEDIVGNYPIDKVSEGFVVNTDLPLNEVGLTTDTHKYMIEILDSKGQRLGQLQILSQVVSQLPSINPGFALFYCPYINVESAYFSLDTHKNHYKIKTIINGSYFEIPFDAITPVAGVTSFEISDGVNLFTDSLVVKKANGGSRYKSTLKVELKYADVAMAKVKPTLTGLVSNYDPGFMNVDVVVNGVSIDAPLNAKGDFKVTLPLRNGYNVIRYGYGKDSWLSMQKFNMPNVGKLEPQLSAGKTSVIAQVPLKFTLPSTARIKLPLRLRLYHADYAEETANTIMTELGTYNIKKDKTVYQTIESIDLTQFVDHDVNFYGFELIDGSNKSIGHYAINYSDTKAEFLPMQGVYKIATILKPFHEALLMRDQLQALDVTEDYVNGVFTIARDIYEQAKNTMYFNLIYSNSSLSYNKLSDHLPIKATKK